MPVVLHVIQVRKVSKKFSESDSSDVSQPDPGARVTRRGSSAADSESLLRLLHSVMYESPCYSGNVLVEMIPQPKKKGLTLN